VTGSAARAGPADAGRAPAAPRDRAPAAPRRRTRVAGIDLTSAASRTLPDVVAPGLRVLFCGINPGLYSAATGYHFARPGNRFWPALHRSGFTARRFRPDEQDLLLEAGLGITNIAPRATARAAELSRDELRAGAAVLTAKVAALRPAWLAVVGMSAFRTAFGRPDASAGPQPGLIGASRVWILPSTSGLNAHWTPDALAAEFARLREASGRAE
jgi:TDG/mug DNA glycosylase family protein